MMPQSGSSGTEFLLAKGGKISADNMIQPLYAGAIWLDWLALPLGEDRGKEAQALAHASCSHPHLLSAREARVSGLDSKTIV